VIDFGGKVVLVSGGGAGIGRATVSAFADLGARVVTMEIDAGRAEQLRSRVGDRVSVIEGDAAARADVAALAETIGEQYGRLDVLVNNVGHFLTRPTPFEKFTDEQIDAVYGANLKHIFLMTRAMLPLLRVAGAGASITNVSVGRGLSRYPGIRRLRRVQGGCHRPHDESRP
jgi:NAD(P)-dependent dehydrogenase (short-subunit alcohol dehydrogenase family)